MMNRISKWPFFLLLLILLGSFGSCITKKKIARAKIEYTMFQKGLDSLTKIQRIPDMRCKPLSTIDILVSTPSLQKEQLEVFDNGKSASYRLDSLGRINYPLVGKINLNNLTSDEASEVIKEKVKKYIKDPYVRVTQKAFNVTLFGEVDKPGNFEMSTQNPTILEALSLANYNRNTSRRDSILVLRQTTESLEKIYIDIRNAQSVFESNAYYLQPNDIVLVAPNDRAIKQYIVGGIGQENVSIQRLNIILGMGFLVIPILNFIMNLR